MGVFDIFAESLLNKELEETKRLIFSNSHMTIDLLSPIIWGVLLSLCLLFVAMAFENKSKFFGLTNGLLKRAYQPYYTDYAIIELQQQVGELQESVLGSVVSDGGGGEVAEENFSSFGNFAFS